MCAEDIYQRIQLGILERRLLPGTKLAEERLAELTGVKVRPMTARRFTWSSILGRCPQASLNLGITRRLPIAQHFPPYAANDHPDQQVHDTHDESRPPPFAQRDVVGAENDRRGAGGVVREGHHDG